MGKKFFFWPLENVFFLVRQNYTTPQNLRAQLSNWKIGADTLITNNIRLFTALIKKKWCFLWKKLVSSIILKVFPRSIPATKHCDAFTLVLPTHSIKFPHSFTHRSINALSLVGNSWDGCMNFLYGGCWEFHWRFTKVTDFELESAIAPQVVGLRWTA